MHEQEKAAFHEAAHIVTFIYLGELDTSVTVEIGNDYGVVRMFRPGNEFKLLIGICAGHCGEEKTPMETWRHSSDYGEALKVAMKVSGDDKQAAHLLMLWAQRRAEMIVEKCWPEIYALAFKLLESVTQDGIARLSGKEIQAALDAA